MLKPEVAKHKGYIVMYDTYHTFLILRVKNIWKQFLPDTCALH